MVADMVAFVASQFTTSTWDVGAQELCSVVLIIKPSISVIIVEILIRISNTRKTLF